MSYNYKAKFVASINNVTQAKYNLQQVYASIVAQKNDTNQQVFTVLKEDDTTSPGFIGTLVVTPNDFERLKKTHKLDCKFEEFPKLMADVIENLDTSKDSFVHLHITEGTCFVIFHGENVHFALKTKLYKGNWIDFIFEMAPMIAYGIPNSGVELNKTPVEERKKTPVEDHKKTPVKENIAKQALPTKVQSPPTKPKSFYSPPQIKSVKTSQVPKSLAGAEPVKAKPDVKKDEKKTVDDKKDHKPHATLRSLGFKCGGWNE
uniref:Spindle assembly abnormal protein 6 N-terminal domain-containing protein n=1 Tax=Acrobeloides nanus TaxID=290746 RepID=A0A914EQ44_9BILA